MSSPPSSQSSRSSSRPPSLVCATIDDQGLDDKRLRTELYSFLQQLGPRDDVLLLPPDYTRFHSHAGIITQMIAEYYHVIDPDIGSDIVIDHDHDHGDDNDDTKSNQQFPQERQKEAPSKIQIMPALGTHAPMTKAQIKKMFGSKLATLNDTREEQIKKSSSSSSEGELTLQSLPLPLFVEHQWRTDVVTIGYVPNELVRTATNGLVDEPWPAQLNKLVWDKRIIRKVNTTEEQEQDGGENNQTPKPEDSLVLSIGQVVPHEVMGMANYNKNLFVGVGGLEAINLSHFIGAVYGMENMMGRADNPLRRILNYASTHFIEDKLDVWYILTVISPTTGKIQGLFIGNTIDCYLQACKLSMALNFTMLTRPPKTMVVSLEEEEFHSTWLGNKAIYRTRMAIADGGNLIVLAPGVCKFGEDATQDAIIRHYGYVGTPTIMSLLQQEKEKNKCMFFNNKNDKILQHNLGTVAHLIHGSSEGRFHITYCPGPKLNKEDIEKVGFQYGDLQAMMQKYNIDQVQDGWNNVDSTTAGDDDEFYYIRNPALGLWAVPSRFEKEVEKETTITPPTPSNDNDNDNKKKSTIDDTTTSESSSSLLPVTKKSKTTGYLVVGLDGTVKHVD